MKQDKNLNFNGMAGDGVNRGKNRLAGNHSGLTAIVNGKRGPTRGNDGACHDPISGGASVKGAPSHVHDTHAPGAYGKAPYRGIGGTQVKKPGAEAKINVGRGPTKGNCGC